MASDRALRIGSYAVLYIVWGSTYLAMRFAVETLPPFALAAARFLVSGAVLVAIGMARKEPRLAPADWRRAALVGLLLLVGGNASVLWAVQRVPSGTAALVVATTPLWLAILSRATPTKRLVGGIVLGLCGVGILVGPSVIAGAARVDPLGVAVLSAASLFWAIGSLVQRGGANTSPLTMTGSQMLCGAVVLIVIAAATGELSSLNLEEASTRSWLSLAYLTVFGSLIGYTAYAWLMRHDEPTRVATYAYVNPIIAVLLGALLADEELSARVVAAAAVIIVGVLAIVGTPRLHAERAPVE